MISTEANKLDGFDSLADLALNLRWSWNHATDEVWRQLAPELWETTHNPWVVLQTASRDQIKRVLAEADFVVLHVHARLTPDERGAVVIDIFRLQHGRIVEHWDAVQPIPQQSMNSSGPF